MTIWEKKHVQTTKPPKGLDMADSRLCQSTQVLISQGVFFCKGKVLAWINGKSPTKMPSGLKNGWENGWRCWGWSCFGDFTNKMLASWDHPIIDWYKLSRKLSRKKYWNHQLVYVIPNIQGWTLETVETTPTSVCFHGLPSSTRSVHGDDSSSSRSGFKHNSWAGSFAHVLCKSKTSAASWRTCLKHLVADLNSRTATLPTVHGQPCQPWIHNFCWWITGLYGANPYEKGELWVALWTHHLQSTIICCPNTLW